MKPDEMKNGSTPAPPSLPAIPGSVIRWREDGATTCAMLDTSNAWWAPGVGFLAAEWVAEKPWVLIHDEEAGK